MADVTVSVPSFIVTPFVNVFVADKINVPWPYLIKPIEPEITLEIVVVK